jgi:hypothetical protein
MSGSDFEPTPEVEQVVEQMREATDRIRGSAWMVTPMTSSVELDDGAEEPAEQSSRCY